MFLTTFIVVSQFKGKQLLKGEPTTLDLYDMRDHKSYITPGASFSLKCHKPLQPSTESCIISTIPLLCFSPLPLSSSTPMRSIIVVDVLGSSNRHGEVILVNWMQFFLWCLLILTTVFPCYGAIKVQAQSSKYLLELVQDVEVKMTVGSYGTRDNRTEGTCNVL